MGKLINVQHKVEEISSILKKTRPYPGKEPLWVNILNKLCYSYWVVNSKAGVDIGLESIRILSCLSFKKGVDRANYLLGNCYAQFLKKPLGIENGLTSFEIAAKKQNLSWLGRTLNNPVSVYQEIEAKGKVKKYLIESRL